MKITTLGWALLGGALFADCAAEPVLGPEHDNSWLYRAQAPELQSKLRRLN